MTFDRNQFDIVIDKGTLDLLLESKDYKVDVALYFSNVERVLKTGGFFVNVSGNNTQEVMHHFKRDHLDFEIIGL